MDPTKPERKGIGRASYLTIWELGAGAIGDPEDISQSAERSIQIDGVFDGARVVIEGSNNGKEYHTLGSHDGMLLQLRTQEFLGVREYCHYLRPRIEGGVTTTKITVSMLVRIER